MLIQSHSARIIVTVAARNERRAKHSAIQSEYEDIQKEVSEIRSQIAATQTRLLETKREMAPYEPIQDLPDEILTMIFEAAYRHDFPYCRRYQKFTYYAPPAHSPLVLTNVCRRWREVAISQSSLWSCIHVFTHNRDKSYNKQLELLKVFLERSGRQKLSIMLSCQHNAHSEDWKDFKEGGWSSFWKCFKLLLNEGERWQHFALFSSYGQATKRIRNALDERTFPCLEYLQLHNDMDECLFNPDPGSIEIYTPALRHFRTQAIGSFDPPTFFDRLTEIKLDFLRADAIEFVDALRHAAPTLERLTMWQVSAWYHKDEPPPEELFHSIPFPRLTQLMLNSCGHNEPGDGMAMILRHVLEGAPALDTFIYWGCNELAGYLPRGAGALAKVRSAVFCIERSWRNEEDVVAAEHAMWPSLIEAFPAVQHVELNARAAEQCFPVLIELAGAAASADPKPWPGLRTLTLPIKGKHGENELLKYLPFLVHRADIGKPVEVLRLSEKRERLNVPLFNQLAPSLAESPAAQELANVPGTSVVWLEKPTTIHAYDGYEHELFCAWDIPGEEPVFCPWNGSVEFEDQF